MSYTRNNGFLIDLICFMMMNRLVHTIEFIVQIFPESETFNLIENSIVAFEKKQIN